MHGLIATRNFVVPVRIDLFHEAKTQKYNYHFWSPWYKSECYVYIAKSMI